MIFIKVIKQFFRLIAVGAVYTLFRLVIIGREFLFFEHCMNTSDYWCVFGIDFLPH